MGVRRSVLVLGFLATIVNPGASRAQSAASGSIAGVLRGISDGEWVCYVADLVVHSRHQRKGIGQGLLDTCKSLLGPGMGIVLVAYPEAESFYRRIGMGEMLAFYIDREIRN